MSIMVNIDKNGRMVLPKAIRKKMKSSKFAIDVEDEKIVFTPVKSIDDMLGSMPNLDLEGFRHEHHKER